MTDARAYAAVDLGASNGRVVVGHVGPDRVELTEVHRFANEPVRLPDGLHWDVVRLYRHIVAGLRRATTEAAIVSAGIDSWAIDYGLLDAGGRLLGLPYHYRDARTARPPGAVGDALDPAALYATTGLQHLPFTTIYQLLREPAAVLDAATTMLLIPDLFGFWLTGTVGAERTNASTTALYDVRTGDWAGSLMDRLGLPARILPPLREPGSSLGRMLRHTGLDRPIIAVASHDTAAAVLGVPATTERFAYVCTGTWSLVGVELDEPVLSEASRAANFTNETGVDGTIRYLRNVMGLWLLQECQRVWGEPDTGALLAKAETARPFAAVVDPDDPSFLAPGDMPARIDAYCARTGQRAPADHGAYVRCILESLALAHRAAIRDAVRLSGRPVEVVHLVGGGARNDLLCRLTADACGLPVIAGPVEATALGNILIQARADGGPADRAAIRRLIARSGSGRRYDPSGSGAAWDAAAARIGRET
jgi:rhamnulokinase